VAGDAALLFEPTNEQAIAEQIDRVLADDATRTELIARGHDRVHAFSWDHTARALASCYRRIAEQRP
jgi:glycosyltransferase involved in cell wall biosynthesis